MRINSITPALYIPHISQLRAAYTGIDENIVRLYEHIAIVKNTPPTRKSSTSGPYCFCLGSIPKCNNICLQQDYFQFCFIAIHSVRSLLLLMVMMVYLVVMKIFQPLVDLVPKQSQTNSLSVWLSFRKRFSQFSNKFQFYFWRHRRDQMDLRTLQLSLVFYPTWLHA